MWTGTLTAGDDIPPKSKYFAAARVSLHLQPNCSEVTTVAHFPHAHFLGRKVWTERSIPSTYGRLTEVWCLFLPTIAAVNIEPH
jgi:hypothetical protein